MFSELGQTHDTSELPGHGAAPAWDPAQDFQSQATQLVRTALHGPTDIVGHSFGATVALRLAIEFPELVRSLVLIEPVYFYAAQQHAPEAYAAYEVETAVLTQAFAVGDHHRAAELFTDMWGVAPFRSLPAAAQSSITSRIGLVAASAPSITLDNANLWPRIGAISVPVILIEGERSPAIISSIHAALVSKLPQSTHHIVAGAGHMSPITHPKAVADLILAAQKTD